MEDMSSIRKKQEEEDLYNEFFTPVFRYLFFRTKDYEFANDLAQSTFLKFLMQRNRPDNKEHSLRLLFTIARTLLIDHWRKESNHKHESIEENNFDTPGIEPTPQEIFEANENILLVKELLESLGESEKEVVTLRITSVMSYDSISKILDISSDNARQIYSRALSKMQKLAENNDLYKRYNP